VSQKEAAKPMHYEDLAALKEVSEDAVLGELNVRHADGLSYTFVGDVLLYVNPNRDEALYEKKVIRNDQSVRYARYWRNRRDGRGGIRGCQDLRDLPNVKAKSVFATDVNVARVL